MNLLNRSTPAGLVTNIMVPIVVVLAGNGLIFSLGWNRATTQINPSFAPPGYVVGIIWVILFGLMGLARWLVLKAKKPNMGYHVRLISSLIAFCFAYPFYTLGLSDRLIGLIGTIATLFVAGWITYQVQSSSKVAAGLIATIVLWLGFATAIVVRTIQLNP